MYSYTFFDLKILSNMAVELLRIAKNHAKMSNNNIVCIYSALETYFKNQSRNLYAFMSLKIPYL